MKLAEAFAKKTYRGPQFRDVMWTRRVPVTRIELQTLVSELSYFVGLRVTPEELAKKYKKQVEQYLNYLEDVKNDYMLEQASDYYENEIRSVVKDIFGNAE